MNAFFDGREPGQDSAPMGQAPDEKASLLTRARRAARVSEGRGFSGVSYERAESLVHLALALTLVGGVAAVLSATVFAPAVLPAGDASAGAVVVAMPKEKAPAEPPQAEPPQAGQTQAGQTQAATAEAPPRQEGAAPAPLEQPSLLDARPMSGRPLPSAATESAAQEAPAPEETAQAQAAETSTETMAEAVPAPAEEPAAQEAPAKETGEGHMAKCFVKVAGRVQMSGACKVAHAGETVRFQLPGKALEISHKSGRVWAATLGGRSLGQVFKSGGCWAARGFYACEKG